MSNHTRSVVTVILTSFLFWTMFQRQVFYMHWWVFVFLMTVIYLVIDVVLKAILERVGTQRNTP